MSVRALTSDDRRGISSHRDHVRVHEVAAAAIAGTSCDLVEPLWTEATCDA